jgi:hypothetical protein
MHKGQPVLKRDIQSNLFDTALFSITKPVNMLDWQQNLTKTLQNATIILNKNEGLIGSLFPKNIGS